MGQGPWKWTQIIVCVWGYWGPFQFQVLIADIYISISMRTVEHREYKSRGEDGNK